MVTPSNAKTPTKITDTKTTPKIEPAPKPEAAPVPEVKVTTSPVTTEVTSTPVITEATEVTTTLVTPEVTTPKKADEHVEKKPFTVMVPVSTYRILAVIGRAEGRSISEIILGAVADADLRGRARKALASLAAEIEE